MFPYVTCACTTIYNKLQLIHITYAFYRTYIWHRPKYDEGQHHFICFQMIKQNSMKCFKKFGIRKFTTHDE